MTARDPQTCDHASLDIQLYGGLGRHDPVSLVVECRHCDSTFACGDGKHFSERLWNRVVDQHRGPENWNPCKENREDVCFCCGKTMKIELPEEARKLEDPSEVLQRLVDFFTGVDDLAPSYSNRKVGSKSFEEMRRDIESLHQASGGLDEDDLGSYTADNESRSSAASVYDVLYVDGEDEGKALVKLHKAIPAFLEEVRQEKFRWQALCYEADVEGMKYLDEVNRLKARVAELERPTFDLSAIRGVGSSLLHVANRVFG